MRRTVIRLCGGLFLSSGIALLAYQRRSLSRGGVVGAVATGTSTFGLGGPAWAGSMIFFFISSTLFSHFRARQKASTAADKFSKGIQRDLGQVAANGGVAALTALAYGLNSSPQTREALQTAFVGAMATANADTWATELGVLSPTAPRLITTGQPVAPGTSGGITPLGSAATAAGAFSLGVIFKLLRRTSSPLLPLIALFSGMIGSLFDSLLGATVQIMHFCPACQKETERRVHNCGTPTQRQRGRRWMDNDMVNFLSTLFGALVALALHMLFSTRQSKQLKERIR